MPGGPTLMPSSVQTTGPMAPGVQSFTATPAAASPQYNNPVQQAVANSSSWNQGSSTVTGSDITRLIQSGDYNANQIMKIVAATGAMEGGKIGARANTMLQGGLPETQKMPFKNNLMNAIYRDSLSDPANRAYARADKLLPRKELKWGGITADGKPLALSGMDFSKNLAGTGKPYTWMPGKGLSAETLTSKNTTSAGSSNVAGDTANTATTTTNTTGAVGGDTGVDTTLPTETAKQPDININMPGSPLDVFSMATGWRSKKSSRGRGGTKAQGLASQRVAPVGGWQYNLG